MSGTTTKTAMGDVSTKLLRMLLPATFKSGHTQYVDYVKRSFRDGCRWLDAGGGRRIFHDWYDGERELVGRARLVVVCDRDPLSLADHGSVSNLVCCDLSRIPVESNSLGVTGRPL